MSMMAMIWADWLAPVPLTDRGTRHTNSWAVLHVLAECAKDDGSDAFPSLALIQHITGLSERSVRTSLRMLEEAGTVVPSIAPIVSVKIRRADRRPNSYDLNMRGAVRWDLSDADLDAIAHRQPLLEPHVDRMRQARWEARREGTFFRPELSDEEPEVDASLWEEQESREIALRLSPATGNDSAAGGDEETTGGTTCRIEPPRPARPAPRRPHGGHHVPERGAPPAPEPLLEPLLTGSSSQKLSPGENTQIHGKSREETPSDPILARRPADPGTGISSERTDHERNKIRMILAAGDKA